MNDDNPDDAWLASAAAFVHLDHRCVVDADEDHDPEVLLSPRESARSPGTP
jgi:hypothetical protein